MGSFIDFIRSSKELLKNCLEMCDSLETKCLSDNLTDEFKDGKLSELNYTFSKLNKDSAKAKLLLINKKQRNDKIQDGGIINYDVADAMSTNIEYGNNSSLSSLSAISSDEKDENAANENDLNIIAKYAILNDSDIETEKLTNTKDCEINSPKDDSNRHVELDITNESEMKFDEDEPLKQIRDCCVILHDMTKRDQKAVSTEDYLSVLGREVNKLSQIPKLTNKKPLNNDQIKTRKLPGKDYLNNKTSTINQSDLDESNDDSDSDSEETCNRSVDIDITDTVMSDLSRSASDMEPDNDISIRDSTSSDSTKKSKTVSNGKSSTANQEYERRVTRSLRIPILSDSETSTGKSKKKGKKVAKTVVCLSSTSDEESDASASDLRRKTTKRKRRSSPKVKGKKPKTDADDESKEDLGEGGTRKNLHKIITKSKLSEATKTAEQYEIERRKRIEERQETYNKSLLNESVSESNVSSLILEKDQNGDPLVQVNELIAEKLKIHQIEAINFMYDCVIESVACLLKTQEGNNDEESTTASVGGCILAHCMGLGKTLSLIAFMHTMLTTPIMNLRSCIVVCPVNTALNWKRELEMWIPANKSLKIFEVCTSETKKYKITIIQDWYKKGGILIIGYEMYRLLATGDNRTMRSKVLRQKMIEALVNPGADFIVCDEGHLLKNEKSAITKVINQVKTRRRIVLTGTPLQNRLLEYHTMVNFVKPNLLGTHKEFLNRFVNPISNGQHINSTPYDVKIMKKRSHILYKTLDGCVHRRDYSALVKYLPPKYEYVIKIRMSDVQINLYKAYLSMIKINRQSLFQDQQSLARIWTHPFVICMHQEIQDKKTFLAESEEESFIDDGSDLESNGDSKTPPPSKKPLEENNMISLLSDDSDNDAKENDGDDVATKSKKNGAASDSDSSVEEVVRNWSTNSRRNVLRDSDDDDDNEVKTKVNSELEDIKDTKVDKHWWSDIIQPDHEHQIEISGKLTILFQILRKASDMGDKVIVFSHSLLVLDIIEKYLFELHTISERVKDDLFKLNHSDEPMETNEEKPHDEFLSDIGYNTWKKGVDYDRMDGSTHLFTRADIQSRFNCEKDRRLRLFLISTKAGGMGVNLVAANRVVIFDVSWNPSHDIQAIFRSYRFGQTKPVYVYRLVSQATMEEKMYERQVTKLSLALRVVDEQQISRYFTEEDLRSLYKFEPDIYDSNKERETPILPKDRFLAELIQEFPQWIFGYHEHDSLLENKDEEELTETDRQEAWKEFEEEKLHGARHINYPQMHNDFDHNQFAQIQINQMNQQYPQYAALYTQNYINLLRFALMQQPDLKLNPVQLGIRMQAIFFQSLEKYKDSLRTNESTSTIS